MAAGEIIQGVRWLRDAAGKLVGYRNPVTDKDEDLNAAAVQSLVSEDWMSPALQALIGAHPTRIFHDDEPLLIDDEAIFHTPD